MNKHGWTYKKLSEVCHPKKDIKRASKHYKSDDYISYIDISSIDNKNNVITETTRYAFCDAPSRAQQIVCSDDVIISMVRPNLKNIAMVREGSNLVASSGFCVLRSRPEVNPSFLFSFVKSTRFTNYLISRVSGANYPAVRESDIINFSIPVPSMEEQEAIVAELDEITEAIEALQQQVADLDALAQSTFYTMFGDPVTNPKGWEVKKLEEIASSKIGLTYKPANVCDNGVIVLRSSNIQNSSIELSDTVRVNVAIPDNKWVRDGDILMCTRNGSFRLVGKVARINNLPERMTYGAFMTVIRSEYKDYLFAFFNSPAFRSQLGSAGTATINQITVRMLNNINVPVPPLNLQLEFAAKVKAIELTKDEINAQIAEMQTLLSSRMDYYFD